MERNLYNGTLAQQHPQTGMIAYWLPLQAGGHKAWGSPTHDFWCCHGTLVQTHTTHNAYVYYEDGDGLRISQYIPTELRWDWQGAPVTVTMTFDAEASTAQPHRPDGALHRPNRWATEIAIRCKQTTEFSLKLRVPWWVAGPASITVNGVPETDTAAPSHEHVIRRVWHDDRVRLEFPKSLTAWPLPDMPDTVAFMDGPVVLAGLCDEERLLHGDPADPAALLTPDHDREWETWKGGYRTVGQERGIRFVPLHDIRDEHYTVYFPVR
jgi:DUF1680 family protein